MKRREFLEKAAAIGGLAVVQPWELVRLLGSDGPGDAMRRLLDWGVRAEAGPVPINYVSRPFKVVPGFDVRTGLSTITTNTPIAGDGTSTVVEQTDAALIHNGGSKNLRVDLQSGTATQVHDLRSTLSPALVMKQVPTIGMRYYAPVGLNNCIMYLSHDALTNNRFQFGQSNYPNSAVFRKWAFLQWHRDEWSGTLGTADWQSDIQVIRFSPSIGSGAAASMYLDQFFYDGYQRPVIVWIFEGGLSTHYSEVFGKWMAKGLAGTLAIPTSSIDQPGFLTSGQIDEMYDAGWDVIHTSDTNASLTGLTVNQVEDRLGMAERFLLTKGWTRTLKHVCLPGFVVTVHRSDDNVETALRRMHFISAVDKWADGASGPDVNPIGIDPEYGISLAPYSVPSWRVESPDTLAEHQLHVRHAIKAGGPRLLRTGSVVASPTSGQMAIADHSALLQEVSLYHHAGTLSAYPYRKFISGLDGRVTRT